MTEQPELVPGTADSAPLSEQEFKGILSSHAKEFVATANGLMEAPVEFWSQLQIAQLAHQSSLLETFLDNYGARENLSFFPLREKVALVRWLSMAQSPLVHAYTRLPSYRLADEAWAREVLGPRLQRAARRLGEMTQHVLKSLEVSWKALQVAWEGQVQRIEGAPSPAARRLRRTLVKPRSSDPVPSGSSPIAAQLASQYLDLLATLERVKAGRRRESRELQEFVITEYGEEFARDCETRAHNIQSAYDTEITEHQERANPELPRLRGAASLALHLLEAATALAHLYERRISHPTFEPLNSEIRALLPESELLNVLVNYCITNGYDVLSRGRKDSDQLQRRCTKQSTVQLRLPDGVTLHARPISLIVSVVNKHGVPVAAEIAGTHANASSMMNMLVAAGSHPEAREVRFTGAEQVLEDLRLLFQCRLGEDGMDLFPPRLEYLKPS